MSTRLNWRLLLGEFVVIVVGVLVALWVDQLREARVNAQLEVEYLESLVVDLEADLAQFDSTEAPPLEDLIAALRAFPELEIAAGEVLYQTIANRGSMEGMRSAALGLRTTLERWLGSGQ